MDVLPVAFLFVCAVFAGILGCASVISAGQERSASLSLYLSRYVALLSEGDYVSPTFLSAFCDFFLVPAVLFFTGISSLGVLIVPLLVSFRVFLLSYAISSFFHVFGLPALFVSLAVFGLEALVTLPVILTLGSHALVHSICLAQGTIRGVGYQTRLLDHVLLLVACGAVLLLALLFQWSVMPQLLTDAAAGILMN